MSQGRIWAIVIVALLHAFLGYAFVTGLAYNFVKNVSEDLKTFDVEEPPPPEEEPPPPEQKQVVPPPVVAPPPIVRTNTLPPQITTVRVAPPAPITYTAPPAPPTPPAPPPPPPPRTVEPARARANLGSYFSDDDYPAGAQRSGEQGTARARLQVDASGRVTSCTITSSSGSSSLDNATCSILRRRARFTPARDSNGNPTGDTVNTPPIVWRLPE